VLAIVIVNWNDAAASIDALRSVHASDPVLRVLVDNASSDDPTDATLAVFPDAIVDRRPRNTGYAAACNRGVRVAIEQGASHVLVMNNDAQLAPDALDELLRAERERGARILAPLIVYADQPGEVWSAGGYLEPPCVRNHHLGLGQPLANYRQSRPVEWATGCALFFSVSTFVRVGPFDEKYFLYLEDVDWCLRAARKGVETWLVPSAVVRHEVSRTTGELTSETIRYYAYRNHFRLAFRYSRGLERVAVAGELVWTLAKIGARSLSSAEYRRDGWYHARTRAIRDFLLGHWGPETPHLASAAA
jgi:GT2 family glycosyltransferase